jgi:hypothetical protein
MAAASSVDGAAGAGSESGGLSEKEKVMFRLTLRYYN